MGYPATNGVVNTNAPLQAIQIPVGASEQPSATKNISFTANLDATCPGRHHLPDRDHALRLTGHGPYRHRHFYEYRHEYLELQLGASGRTGHGRG